MGKRKRESLPFGMIPEEVMASEAWRTLNRSAQTTLLVIAVQYRGQANGIQVLTREICRRYGLSRASAMRDVRELLGRGLIARTYVGRSSPAPQRRHPSQYALSWKPITHRDGQLLDRPEPAPNGWAQWPKGAVANFERTHGETTTDSW